MAAHLPLSDTMVGVVLMIFSLLLLCSCLVSIVKILGSLLKGEFFTTPPKLKLVKEIYKEFHQQSECVTFLAMFFFFPIQVQWQD